MQRRTFLSTVAGTSAIALTGLSSVKASTVPAAAEPYSKVDMTFTPQASFPMPSAPVLAKLQDFVLALRTAETTLDMAEEEITGNGPREVDLLEAKATARLYVGIFGSIVKGAPSTISPRVFHAIENYTNQSPGNTPHIEGAMLAISLALHSLKEAMDLSAELDGDKIDAAYELMMAADFALAAHHSMIEGVTYHFHHDDVFAAIMANGPMPDHQALRREAIAEHKRSKAAMSAAA